MPQGCITPPLWNLKRTIRHDRISGALGNRCSIGSSRLSRSSLKESPFDRFQQINSIKQGRSLDDRLKAINPIHPYRPSPWGLLFHRFKSIQPIEPEGIPVRSLPAAQLNQARESPGRSTQRNRTDRFLTDHDSIDSRRSKP